MSETAALAARIRGLRKASKLTQAALGHRSGLGLGIIKRLEAEGRAVTLGEAVRISRALGVTLNHLAGVEDEN